MIVAQCARMADRGRRRTSAEALFKATLEACLRGERAAGERRVIERWLADPRGGEVWRKIAAAAERHDGALLGTAEAALFTEHVLRARKAAELVSKLAADTPRIQAELAADFAKYKRSLARMIEGAQSPLQLAFMLAPITKVLRRAPPRSSSAPTPIIRSDRSGARARTIFMRDISNITHDLTGCWLDAEVAMLTDIAFDQQDVSADAVRKARHRADLTGHLNPRNRNRVGR